MPRRLKRKPTALSGKKRVCLQRAHRLVIARADLLVRQLFVQLPAGKVLLGGGIGAIIDHTKGGAYTYPTWVRLVFGRALVFERSTENSGQPELGTELAKTEEKKN